MTVFLPFQEMWSVVFCPLQCLSQNVGNASPFQRAAVGIFSAGVILGTAQSLRRPYRSGLPTGPARNAAGPSWTFPFSVAASAILGTVQTFMPPFSRDGLAAGLTQKAAGIANIDGPGVVDIAGYVHSIAAAGGPEAANRVAADGIYGMLMGPLGDAMNPLVDTVLDMGGGAALQGAGSTEGASPDHSGPGQGDRP